MKKTIEELEALYGNALDMRTDRFYDEDVDKIIWENLEDFIEIGKEPGEMAEMLTSAHSLEAMEKFGDKFNVDINAIAKRMPRKEVFKNLKLLAKLKVDPATICLAIKRWPDRAVLLTVPTLMKIGFSKEVLVERVFEGKIDWYAEVSNERVIRNLSILAKGDYERSLEAARCVLKGECGTESAIPIFAKMAENGVDIRAINDAIAEYCECGLLCYRDELKSYNLALDIYDTVEKTVVRYKGEDAWESRCFVDEYLVDLINSQGNPRRMLEVIGGEVIYNYDDNDVYFEQIAENIHGHCRKEGYVEFLKMMLKYYNSTEHADSFISALTLLDCEEEVDIKQYDFAEIAAEYLQYYEVFECDREIIAKYLKKVGD